MTISAPLSSAFEARTQRRLIASVQILGLAVWFSATAIGPALRRDWGLSTSDLVWLTSSVQLGFVAGAVAASMLNLPDRVRPQCLIGLSCLGGAATTATFVAIADGLATAIPLRFVTGVFMAGIYPVGMKLMASWTLPVERGWAFGVLVGCLTLGSTLPFAINAFDGLDWQQVMLAAAAASTIGGVIIASAARLGPYFEPSPKPDLRHALVGFRARLPRLANIGYFGHMWELYALWTWLPFFIAARESDPEGRVAVSLVTFVSIGVGGAVGSLVSGRLADTLGRARAAGSAVALSGVCCLVSPLLFHASVWVFVPFLFVWGAAVIADSGVYSAALSETVDQRLVGTALAAQAAVGYTLTAVSIQALPLWADEAGWQFAFWLVAPGPLLAVWAMARYDRASDGRAARG